MDQVCRVASSERKLNSALTCLKSSQGSKVSADNAMAPRTCFKRPQKMELCGREGETHPTALLRSDQPSARPHKRHNLTSMWPPG